VLEIRICDGNPLLLRDDLMLLLQRLGSMLVDVGLQPVLRKSLGDEQEEADSIY
jgi:hypothetical protein